MGWNPNVFWRAFKSANMLDSAMYQPAAGPAVPVDVGFVEPYESLMDEMVNSKQYQIEYETAAMPRLRVGEILIIQNETYAVRNLLGASKNASARHVDGHFSMAQLTKV